VPTFDTPEAVPVELDLVVANTTIDASYRVDTVIEVRPSDPGQRPDVEAAENTRIELVDGRLLVRQPRQKRLVFGKPGSVEVTVELPTGTPVRAKNAVGEFRATGELGDSTFRSATGDIHLDRVGALELHTSAGATTVEHATGRAEITTGSGELRVRRLDGPAVLKNSNGATWIGFAGDDLRVKAANGNITVDRTAGGVTAQSSNGNIRVGELVRGAAALKTSFGGIEVAVRRGTAVRLDLYTNFGKVRNELDATDGPAAAEETAELEARTSYGDITISRAQFEEETR
jgi:DUF4097 and DUF4098 domain-containing protein YvlB